MDGIRIGSRRIRGSSQDFGWRNRPLSNTRSARDEAGLWAVNPPPRRLPGIPASLKSGMCSLLLRGSRRIVWGKEYGGSDSKCPLRSVWTSCLLHILSCCSDFLWLPSCRDTQKSIVRSSCQEPAGNRSLPPTAEWPSAPIKWPSAPIKPSDGGSLGFLITHE